jgi:L-cystine uptake protein TcyP (sodium:dicarboxylate symporter family)
MEKIAKHAQVTIRFEHPCFPVVGFCFHTSDSMTALPAASGPHSRKKEVPQPVRHLRFSIGSKVPLQGATTR